ncbi:hypothetical protein AB6A40_001494 [Gnathostoma spinigerum]|uniref:Uncharacterized protein n=1 Tax=Gnathostoma spinigerum TaxID=75299 RepID=A0ABD6E5B1_9BILA
MQWRAFGSLVALIFILDFAFQVLLAGGPLWCHEGGGNRRYTPINCDSDVYECYKVDCYDNETPFVARGCGVGRTISMSFPNQSCAQALELCDMVGGHGICHLCSHFHMCNRSTHRSVIVGAVIASIAVAFLL